MSKVLAPDIRQQNAFARSAILANAIEMTQSIFSTTIATPGSTANVINIAPRNVGLIKGFLVEIDASIAIANVNDAVPTQFGLANILSQIVFNDLNNNVRINTTGWHLNFLDSAKSRRPYGAAFTTDTPINYGSNWNVITSDKTITKNTTEVKKMFYWIPLAYSDDDLRGSVYANVVNATMNLQLTLNPNPVVDGAAVDATLAVYDAGAGGSGSFTTVTVQVYQVYLDQLPIGQRGPVLPVLDLSTIYELKNTSLTGISANQDFPVPYANFRDFLSTFAIYDNAAVLNVGSDINYWALQSANFTNIFKIDPFIAALNARKEIMDDFPKGVYYFAHRRRPISTIQYGNMQLVLNASSVGAGPPVPSLLMGFEAFALVNTISGAGSLAAS